MTKQSDFLDALHSPATSVNGMVTGISPSQRLQMAMRLARDGDQGASIPSPDSYSFGTAGVGVPNPYGRGVAAFEPNNIIIDAYAQAKGEADAANAQAAAETEKTGTVDFSGALLGNTQGGIGKAIQAAMTLAQRAVPYVWGGVGPNGVDCSGLLAYAFRQVDPNFPRYRAVDYAHLGTGVPDVASARPGDVIYYDEPGDTDHVGLYIGNGLMIQAPQTGDHVRVTSVGKPTAIRRLFDDSSFANVLNPDGSATVTYNGQPYRPWGSAPISPVTNPGVIGSTITRGNIGRMRPI